MSLKTGDIAVVRGEKGGTRHAFYFLWRYHPPGTCEKTFTRESTVHRGALALVMGQMVDENNMRWYRVMCEDKVGWMYDLNVWPVDDLGRAP